jgi:WD40 repeat protein
VRLLDDCREEQPRWEWQYLKRLCHAELLSLEGDAGTIRRVAFSPDGRRLAWGGDDKIVKVWDMTTGQLQCKLPGHTDRICGMAFSPDGNQLASASAEREVIIWDVITAKQLHSWPIKVRSLCNLAYSPDGTRLASATGYPPAGSVKVWNATTGQEILDIPDSSELARTVVFSPDGKRLAWGTWDRIAKVWDLEARQVLFTITGHRDFVAGIGCRPVASAGGLTSCATAPGRGDEGRKLLRALLSWYRLSGMSQI